ncbi:AAA family ATPase [Nocardia tengchongensis]|uniref:AAA family ATPase n=1 Tax=Nocardia tengchongensis TaxID=2055889 RepID=UPI003693FBF3
MLKGRGPEIESLIWLVRTDPVRGGVLLLSGDPGIGKTALLRAAESAAVAGRRRVLSIVGVEAEAMFPFPGLHPWFRPVLNPCARLSETQRDALLGAFGLATQSRPDPFLIALAALELITVIADEEPVVILADDVQWLDPESHETLTFIARRITPDLPIVIIAAARIGHTGPLIDADFPNLVVKSVDDDAAEQILRAHAPHLTDTERRRVHREALGNPLALRELPAVVRRSPGQRSPSLTDRLERAFAGRIVELPPPTRDAVLIATIDPVGKLTEILAATSVLRGAAVSADVLEPAESAGLLCVTEGRAEFRHPLIRSGILQSESMIRRQAAHGALAEVLTSQPYRQTWHQAQSIIGPDDAVADRLEANATIALARGAVMAAINDLERSAQLSSSSGSRGHRLLLAAEHAFDLGRADIVTDLLAAATRTELSEHDTARLEWLREIFNDGVPGDAVRVFELCDVALRSAAGHDADLALNLLLGASLRCWWADTGPAARTRVITVTRGLTACEDDPRYLAILAVAEPVLCARTVIDSLGKFDPAGIADGDALRLLTMAAHAVGDEPTAADFLAGAEEILRHQGRLGLLSQVLSMAVMVNLTLGNLDRASAAAEEGIRLAVETGQPIWRTGTTACESVHQALRGHAEQALELAAEAELAASRGQLNDLLSCVQLARGIAWLSAGRDRDAYLALRRAFDPADASYHQRERFGALMFLADAAVRAGHRTDATQILTRLEPVARTTPTPILGVHLRYARAVLAEDDDAEDLYLLALCQDLSRWPLAKAKTELAYGSWLRRMGRADHARTLLRRSQEDLDRIGALAWADDARAESRANGDEAVWATPDSVDVRQRRQNVADLVAKGLTESDIAQVLCVAPATVDLYRRYSTGS